MNSLCFNEKLPGSKDELWNMDLSSKPRSLSSKPFYLLPKPRIYHLNQEVYYPNLGV